MQAGMGTDEGQGVSVLQCGSQLGVGRYETTLRIPRGGKWEFRVAVQHDSETFTHIELYDVNAPRALR